MKRCRAPFGFTNSSDAIGAEPGDDECPVKKKHKNVGPFPYPVHSLDLCEALKNLDLLAVADWEKGCEDTRHACQDPMRPMRTILETNESHRQTVAWKILAGSQIVVHVEEFDKKYESTIARTEVLNKSLQHVLLRRISIYEQLVFQGLDFLKFDAKLPAHKIHGLIGNSLPPRVAACFFAAMKKVQILRMDPRVPNEPLGRLKSPSGWVNPTMIELFAGLGGLSLGADYVDDWSPRLGALMAAAEPLSGGFCVKRRSLVFASSSNRRSDRGPYFVKPLKKNVAFIEEPLNFEHLLLVDFSERSYDALQASVRLNPSMAKWKADRVVLGDAGKVDLMPYRDKVGMICGGPPCQPFSIAGRRGGMSDERQGWRICARALLITNAESFLFENVKALCTGKMAKHLSEIKLMLSDPHAYFRKTPFAYNETDEYEDENDETKCDEGNRSPSSSTEARPKRTREELDDDVAELVSTNVYPYRWTVGWVVVDCSDFGVPQLRDRVFFYGYRTLKNTLLYLGDPLTRTEEFLQYMKLPDKRTAWEVMRDSAERNDKILMEQMSLGEVSVNKALGVRVKSKDEREKQGESEDLFALWRKLPSGRNCY